MKLVVPELSLVVLVGVSGAGKSTFAARHFGPYETLSSDHYRGVVANDPLDQSASADAFKALEQLVEIRLARGLLTVIDATNVRAEHRKPWVALAKRFHVIPVAIVLDVHPKVAHARNASRPDRAFGEDVVRRQARDLKREVRDLQREGFRYVYTVGADDEVVIERPRPWTDRRDEHGPFDIIGDIHGCSEELDRLLAELGWSVAEVDGRFVSSHPAGRRLIYLGDLVDRGPDSPGVLRRVMDQVDQGVAICVPGNHEARLQKWFEGRNIKLSHGLQQTVEQLAGADDAFRVRVHRFIEGLVSHFVFDGGRLVVAHAGMKEELAGRASGKVRQFALYGETTGEIDEYGLPVRSNWAADYRGRAAVVYGHTPVPYAEWLNGTICIDTGCVFGGELTALRWPERELVAVPAVREHYAPIRPLHAVSERPAQQVADDLPDLDDVFGGRRVETRFKLTVPVRAENAAAALEVLTRFAVHPRWLVHLPPTMAPSETTARAGLLEHPDEAFATYRSHGVQRVVCETKHMGSRALVFVGRTPEALAARLGFDAPVSGHVITRRGRAFFDDPALTAGLVDRVRRAFDAEGLWDELGTDWALLDGELMPWSAKARALLEQQYAPVGTAARTALGATSALLRQAAGRQGVGELLARTVARADAADRYVDAYRRYCWPVDGLDDLRFAPFHLLATEGRVHSDKPHPWHMRTLARLAPHDPVLMATDWRELDLDDAAAVADAVAWWEAHTAAGGEGMVVKPHAFLAWHKGRLVQPAVKCRGKEYLRLIYGPEYTFQLDRLRDRGVGRKRGLALQEFALGLEGLERFVAREPLRRVHACALAILALESEPVDPRL